MNHIRHRFSPVSLIINADDFGLHPAINAGIITLVARQRLSSASVMIHAPYISRVRQFVSLYPAFDLGIHLDIGYKQSAAETFSTLTKQLVDNFRKQIKKFRLLLHKEPSNLSLHEGREFRKFLKIPMAPAVLACAVSIIENDTKIKLRSHIHKNAITLIPSHTTDTLWKLITQATNSTKAEQTIIIICHPAYPTTPPIPLPSAYPLSMRYKEFNFLTKESFGHMLNVKGKHIVNFTERSHIYDKISNKKIGKG